MTTKVEKQIAQDRNYCSTISWLLLNFAVEEQLNDQIISFEESVVLNSFLGVMHRMNDIPEDFLKLNNQKTIRLHGYQIGVVKLIDKTIMHIKTKGYVDDDPHKV